MPDLNVIYLQTIDEHKDYLTKLQEAFNIHCAQITAQTQQRLKEIPENDIESRGKIIEEQKKLLDEALSQLKKEINESGAKNRKKLEEIHTLRENMKIKELEDILTR